MSVAAEPPLKDRPLLRRPIAATWIEPGKLLAVANQRSGTVSIVDVADRKVLDEIAVGERLADITAGPRGWRLFAVDEKRHELIILDQDGESLRIVNRVPVSPFPVSVAISPDGGRITVASSWSRKLTVFEPNIDLPAEAAQVRKLAEVPVPFAPQKQLFLPLGKRVLVADSFGGRLAIVDLLTMAIAGEYDTGGHNIGGLECTSDEEITFVAMARSAHGMGTTEERVYAGEVTSAVIARLLFDSRSPEPILGEIGSFRVKDLWTGLRGSTPAGIVQSDNNRMAVVMADSGSLIEWELNGGSSNARSVVPGAAEIVAAHNGSLIVVNRDDESLSILRPSRKGSDPITLGPKSVPTSAERGEKLFHSASLSAGRWMSCHSCHTDGHTNGQLADTLGDGTYGTPKRIPTLLGTRLSDPWAWNGSVRELHEQVQKSLENTMHAPKFSPQDVLDITAFLHTLPPPPPLEPATKAPKDIEQLARGEGLFQSLGCAKCHVPPLTYTSPEVYDVGLEDEKGLKKFNPPSLRGVSQGYSFFHDGRAKTLESVFTEHAHQLDRPLEKDELADLLRFLRSL